MKTTYLPLGIIVLLALSACSGEKEAPPVTPAVPAAPAPAQATATPKKATPTKTHTAKPVRRSVKKEAPKPAGPTTETIKKPEEIIRTQTIVS